MAMLPIVERELRVAARRNKTYWLRLAAALAALGISLWICLWTGRNQPPYATGRGLFAAMSVLALGYCLLVGPFITADCVSEEKRDGTLGLLFLTDLRSYDVVLGKWVASSLAGFCGLLAIVPALGLPLLLGGVTPAEYGRTALAVINAILFSLTAGMFVSALSREQTKATLGAVLVILGFTGLVPGVVTLLSTTFFPQPAGQLPKVVLLSPAYTGYLAQDAVYRAAPRDYWLSLSIVHGMSWLFMIITSIVVPRIWRESPEEKPARQRWLWRLGYTRGWRRLFQRRLETNPVFALAARLRWPYLVFWFLVSLVAINVYWFTYGYKYNPGARPFHVYFSHTLVFTNRVWITVVACWFFLEARRTGALELLLTTPLPVRTLLRGHWRALRRLCFWPVLAIAGLHVFYVFANWRLNPVPGANAAAVLRSYGVSAAGSLLSFLTDVLALCWVGAWLSLSSRKATLAILKAYTYVVLIPWVVATFLPYPSTLLSQKVLTYALGHPFLRQFLVNTPPDVIGRPLCWLLKNSAFILWAHHGLHRHFRAAASQTHGLERWRPFRRWQFFRRAQPSAPALAPAGQTLPGPR